MNAPVLEVKNLCVSLTKKNETLSLVRDVSFTLAQGETLALVGESGSGKSLTGLALLRVLAKGLRWETRGSATLFDNTYGANKALFSIFENEMRAIRGHKLAMIFQEPMTCLNPVLRIGEQIAESARLHLKMDRKSARAHALRALQQVEIPAAQTRIDEYPHQLSGGMRQRVMIAMAIACAPQVLIADEPTTALDVTIQAQILALLKSLQRDTGMAMLFITHNLGVVAHHADRVAVMRRGELVETRDVHDLFASPAHEYTRALLASLPGRKVA